VKNQNKKLATNVRSCDFNNAVQIEKQKTDSYEEYRSKTCQLF